MSAPKPEFRVWPFLLWPLIALAVLPLLWLTSPSGAGGAGPSPPPGAAAMPADLSAALSRTAPDSDGGPAIPMALPTPTPTHTPTPAPTPTLEAAGIYLSANPDRFPLGKDGETQRTIQAHANQPLTGLLYEWTLNGTPVPTATPGPQRFGAGGVIGSLYNCTWDTDNGRCQQDSGGNPVGFADRLDVIRAVVTLPGGGTQTTPPLEIEWKQDGKKPDIDIEHWSRRFPGGPNFILFLGPTVAGLAMASATRSVSASGTIFALCLVGATIAIPGVSLVLVVVLAVAAIGIVASGLMLGVR